MNIKNIKRGKLFKDVTKIRNITEDIVSSYGQNPKSNFLRDASMDRIRSTEPIVNPESTEKRSDRDPTAAATEAEMEKQNGKLWEDTYGTDPYMTQLQDWLTSEQTAEQTAQQSIEQAAEQTTEHTAPNPANTLDPDTEVTPGTGTPPKTPEQTISEIADKIQKPGITSGKARIAAQQLYAEAEKYGEGQTAMPEAYQPGQDPKRFASGFQNAFILGKLGEKFRLGDSNAISYLTEDQRESAFTLGVQLRSQKEQGSISDVVRKEFHHEDNTMGDRVSYAGMESISSRQNGNLDVENEKSDDTINSRGFAMSLRKPKGHILTQEEIERVLFDAKEIGVDITVLRINEGQQTCFFELSNCIYILEETFCRIHTGRRPVIGCHNALPWPMNIMVTS